MKFLSSILFCGILLWGGCASREEKSQITNDGLTAQTDASSGPAGSMGSPEGKEEAAAVASEEIVMRRARPDEVGQLAFCPVMKTQFKVKAVTDVADYKGKSYYFCCAMCPTEFGKNPQKYAR